MMMTTMTEYDSSDETTDLIYGEIMVVEKDGTRSKGLQFTGAAVFGRDALCDVRINLPYISRRHALLKTDENGEVVLENLASSPEATLHNEEPVYKPVVLKHMDVITCADRRFQFFYSQDYLKSTSDCVTGKPSKKKRSVLGASESQNNNQGNDSEDSKPTMKKGLNTPLRNAIKSRAMNTTSVQAADESPATTRLEKSRSIKANQVLPTPVREQIQSRGKKATTTASQSLPTPLKKEIQKVSTKTSAPKSAPTPLKKEVQSFEKTSLHATKKSAPTPLKKEVKAFEKTNLNATKKSAPTPLKKEVQAFEKTNLNATKKSAPTPLKKEVQAFEKTNLNATKKSAPTPLKKEVQAFEKTNLHATKKSAPTPLKTEVKAFEKSSLNATKKSAPTPLKKEINSFEKSHLTRTKKSLPTPLKTDLTAADMRTLRATKKSMPTPVKDSIEQADPNDLNRVLKTSLTTPIRHELVNHDGKLRRVDTPKRDFSRLPNSAAKYFARHMNPESPVSSSSPGSEAASYDERTELETILEQEGFDPAAYKDWTVDDLEQRVRSLCMKDDYVVGTLPHPDDEATFMEKLDAAATPLEKKFRGVHQEFKTPATPDREYEKYEVHWDYDDYNQAAEEVVSSLCEELESGLSISQAQCVEETAQQEDSFDEEQSVESNSAVITEESPVCESQSSDTPVQSARRMSTRSCTKTPAVTPQTRSVSKSTGKSLRVKSVAKSTGKKSTVAAAIQDDEELIISTENLAELKVDELRSMLVAAGQDSKGRKAELIERLQHLDDEQVSKEEEEEEVVEADEIVETENIVEAEEEEQDTTEENVSSWSSLKVAELRERLAALGLDTSGKKDQLVERLENHYNVQVTPQFVIPELLKMNELRHELTQRGIVASGRKAELIKLLNDAYVQQEMNFKEKSADGEVFLKQGHELLWQRYSQEVDGQLFDGIVVGYLPATEEEPDELFRVRYADMQCDDLEREQVESGINLFEERH